MKPSFQIRIKGGWGLSAFTLGTCLCFALATSAFASIDDAVDSPSLPWSTGGSVSWFSQTTTSHDSIDAAESGDIADSQESWIQTAVTGPGVLVFWWKVSCEAPINGEIYDFLSFQTNGVIYVDPTTQDEAIIAGETGWERQVIELSAGLHTLRWQYEKDVSDSAGSDAGWLDQVQFYTNNIPPIILEQPDSATTAGVGGPAAFTIAVLGTEPLDYQWRHNGVSLSSGGRLGGAETDALTISPVQAGDIGRYVVVVTNAYGSLTSNPSQLYTFDQVLDSSLLVWTPGGDSSWVGQTNETHDGVDAAASGIIGNNQSSWVQATAFGPGSLSFWWKVDCELGVPSPQSGETLGFYQNGTLVTYLSGPGVDWTNQVVALAAGQHTLEWRYIKDFSLSGGQDRGWLDQVTYIPDGPPPFTLSPSGFTGGLFQVTLEGQPDQVYRLYSSSNLLDWIPVQTNSDPSGVVTFTDSSGTGYPHRYYRAETDPD